MSLAESESNRKVKSQAPDQTRKWLASQTKLMRLLGFYHQKSDSFILKLYQLLVISVLWLNLARSLTIFHWSKMFHEEAKLTAMLVYKLVVVAWLTVCCTMASLIYMVQEKESRFVANFNELYNLQFCDRAGCAFKRLSYKLVFILLAEIGLLIFQLVAMVCMIMIQFSPDTNVDGLIEPFYTPFERNSLYGFYHFLIFYVFCMSSVSMYSSLAYFCMQCAILDAFFSQFNHQFFRLLFRSSRGGSECDRNETSTVVRMADDVVEE
jgi:hypothetical protein